MPGRNPGEAVDAFLTPIRRALAVLDAHTQVVTEPRGGWRLKQVGSWLLNSEDGASLPGLGRLQASMRFMVVECDPAKHEGAYRVTTRSYRYQLLDLEGKSQWRMDWHPEGPGAREEPHLHRPPDMALHYATSRISFERVIRWCITAGARLTCSVEEAEARLMEIEAPFRLHQSWTHLPSEPRG